LCGTSHREWLCRCCPTVEQHLAAIRVLFDRLVTGGLLAVNPAAAVRRPKHVARRGSGAPQSGEWKAQFWCRVDFLDSDPTDKPTYCRHRNGGEWRMHHLHRCYGRKGWCDG